MKYPTAPVSILSVLSVGATLSRAAPGANIQVGRSRHHVRDDVPIMPHDPNTNADCTWWWDNDGSFSCDELLDLFGVSREDFVFWNPSITNTCGNYNTGFSYCVEGPAAPPVVPSVTITATPVSPSATTTGVSSSQTSGNVIKTPSPPQPSMVNNCDAFHYVEPGQSCEAVLSLNGITVQQLFAWNPSVKSDCTGLWSEVYVCVSVIGHEPGSGTTTTTTSGGPTSTTAPGNGIATPTPILPGMVTNCNAFYYVEDGQVCDTVLSRNGITLAQLFAWNPNVKSDCSGLWIKTYVCVNVIGHTITSTTGSSSATSPPTNVPSPIQTPVASNCNKYHKVASTSTTCQAIADYWGLKVADMNSWNPSIDSACSNLKVNHYVCVGVLPSPIQTPVAENCNKYHKVASSSTTCQAIADYNNIKLADLKSWNPSLNSACSNLAVNSHVCVGVLPSPIQAPVAVNCNKYHQVASTSTTCQAIATYNNINLSDFFKWNPSIDSKLCSNLLLKYYVCVGVPGASPASSTLATSTTKPSATSTTPSNGITTPTPVQPNMTKNCKSFHLASLDTTTCQGIADYRKISLADFFKWNPDVGGADCKYLWKGYWYCYAVL
ncbi:hypothetical protein QBC35DRAFT_475109 [Podospora australis]|uniref:LysM domain-containing protein n=1 Tax=Podospora australis TaxID=1536484 RepID=A0AAN7AGW4_9PEZI|nr:hypothetical protein QBC35DRAFT_475109 [Podospora australis]